MTAGLAAWYGWVLAAAFALSPLAAWVGPLAFAPIGAAVGLFTLPAMRVRDRDRPAAIALIVLVTWAVSSTIWSPFKPQNLEKATATKLVVEAAFYWAAACAALATTPAGRNRALRIFAWGTALIGLVMLVEGMTGAAFYRGFRDAIGDPIRPDLGVKNVAQGLFVLALFAPAAALAAARVCGAAWLALPMAAGLIVGSVAFDYDAPLMALVFSGMAGLAVYRFPTMAPRILAGLTATFFLTAPALVLGARALGVYEPLAQRVPPSWAQRMGYWRHASDWILDHPLRGWGLDSSRMFAPGIQLHPHDSALQLWLELGLIGAMAAAVFWAAILANLSRPKPDAGAAAAVATAVVYLTFGAFSFGLWQEWWLALGGLAAVAAVAVQQVAASAPKPARRLGLTGRSTITPISE